MNKLNMYDFKDAIARGNDAEAEFKNRLSAYGHSVVKSSNSVDIFNHIDYYINIGANQQISVDVKSAKGNNIWIELKNVQGRKGWLYGKADYIVFEYLGEFHFVNRERLAELVPTLVVKEFVNRPQDALYKLYTRKGRKDLLTKINFSDLVVDFKI